MKLVYDKAFRTIKKRRPCGACGGRGYFDYYGDMLRHIRKNASLSLREVARRLKLTPAYICDIELNRRGSTKRVMDYYESLKGTRAMTCPGCGSDDPSVRYVVQSVGDPEPHECENGFHEG